MNSILKQAFSFLQKIGKSLMLPVSVLPVAGILLGVGAAHFGLFPEVVSNMMAHAGDAIFSNLPVMFAIGVALGLTKNDGVAALAAMIGYAILLASMGVMAKLTGVETKEMMGIQTINTGVFGGILVGAISAYMFNKFYKIELPPYLGFFAGKRFVPIVTALSTIVAGIVLSYVWPPIGDGIHSFSKWAASENPGLAFTIYGIGERSLIPFGLHHIWNVPFFFETGSYLDPVTGKTVTGELARYLAGDPTAGNLAGGYLFKMWGLPAAALAIWHTARPENKKRIAGIMISAALTSFVTGITEPIEFSFLFVAPILYAIHAFLSGGAFLICILLGIKHGTTFSHGLIDYLVLFSKSTNGLGLLVLGPIWAGAYYSIFRFAIQKFDLKTPGREVETLTDLNSVSEESFVDSADGGTSLPAMVLKALGGSQNIKSLDACITRLRVEVNHMDQTNSEKLKELGASGVVVIGNGLQAIFGTQSENLKTKIEEIMKNPNRVSATKGSTATSSEGINLNTFSQDILADLGGAQNIHKIEWVGETRYRALVKDMTLLRLNSKTANKYPMTSYPGGVVHIITGQQL